MKQPGQHLEKTVQQGVDKPQQWGGEDKEKLKRFGDPHQDGGNNQGDQRDFQPLLILRFRRTVEGERHAGGAKNLHHPIGEETGGITERVNGVAGDFGQENRLSANDGLTIDQQLTADRGKNERRPDQMMQPGGDQEPVEKAVQEDPDGAKGFHKAGQRRNAQLHYRPEIDGGDGEHANQRQHHDQHQLTVAVDRQRAAKLNPNHAIMDKGDSAAKDNPKEYAHIDNLKTEDKGLSAAVQLRVGGSGRQAMGEG